MNEIRPITIRSRYQNIFCPCCGAPIVADVDRGENDEFIPTPEDHEDDCPRAYDPDPRIDQVALSRRVFEILEGPMDRG